MHCLRKHLKLTKLLRPSDRYRWDESPGSNKTGLITSNIVWNAINELIGRGTIVLTTIYLARILGPKEFGILTLAQTAIFYLWFSVDLGTMMYGVREVSRNRNALHAVVNPLLGLRLGLSVGVYGLLVAVSYTLDWFYAIRLYLLGGGTYLITFGLFPAWVLRGLEKFRQLAFLNIASSVALAASTLTFISDASDGPLAIFLWAASYGIATGLFFLTINRSPDMGFFPSFRPYVWWLHLRQSIYFSASGLLTLLLHNCVLYYLYIFESTEVLGEFAAVFRVILAAGAASFIVLIAIYPRITALYDSDRHGFARTQGFITASMTALGIGGAGIVFLFNDFLVQAILDPEYDGSAQWLRLLIWLVPLYFYRNSLGISLHAGGYQRQHSIATGVAASACVALGFIMVRTNGAAGAAWTLLISELLYCVAMTAVYKYSDVRASA